METQGETEGGNAVGGGRGKRRGGEEAYVGLGVRNVETTPAFRSQIAPVGAGHSYYHT